MFTPKIDDTPMPPLTPETIDEDGVNMLRLAIVEDAAKLYAAHYKALIRHPLPGMDVDAEMRSEERFFKGAWFKKLTMDKISGEWMIKALRAKAQKEVDDEKRSNMRKSDGGRCGAGSSSD